MTTCDERTLRSAVGVAGPGDTVTVTCGGTITLAAPITLYKGLTHDGSGRTVIISGGDRDAAITTMPSGDHRMTDGPECPKAGPCGLWHARYRVIRLMCDGKDECMILVEICR